MEVKTSDLTMLALDWAVCVAEYGYGADYKTLRFSTNWAQGGPIIERAYIELHTYSENDDGIVTWRANDFMDGPTPLIAAMRCYVASKLGDTVDVPTELLGD
jgi:hypothetical protein